MSLDEYEIATDDMYNTLSTSDRIEYKYARDKAKAWDAQEEYFFMKGWVARAVL